MSERRSLREEQEKAKERVRTERLGYLTARYPKLKQQEAELSGIVESADGLADADYLTGVMTRLATVRHILSTFPEEVVESCRRAAEQQRHQGGDGNFKRVEWLRRDITRITQDIAGLDIKLAGVPTQGELNVFRGTSDPAAGHFNLLRVRKSEALAPIEQHLAEIAEYESRRAVRMGVNRRVED